MSDSSIEPSWTRRATRVRAGTGLAVHSLLRALLVVASVVFTPPTCARTPGEVAIGDVLPDATLLGLNGPSRQLSAFRGQPLIINVWASWCGPCISEMASLERLAWHDEATRFAVIGISTDDYRDRAMGLLKGTRATISHFIDQKLLLENMLGASRLPLTVLVDAQGRVVDKVYGAKQWDSPDALRVIRTAFRYSAPVAGAAPKPRPSGER